MNSLDFFQKIEDEELRGDKYETLHEQNKASNIRISLGNNKIGYASKGFFRLWNNSSYGNIYSMYALITTDNLDNVKIDNECKRFGDSCIFILDINEFINRVTKPAKRAGYDVVYAPVEYHDTESFQDKWSVFKKPLQYAYQSEFRFFIRREEAGPLYLELGSLEDISVIAESYKIDSLKVSRPK